MKNLFVRFVREDAGQDLIDVRVARRVHLAGGDRGDHERRHGRERRVHEHRHEGQVDSLRFVVVRACGCWSAWPPAAARDFRGRSHATPDDTTPSRGAWAGLDRVRAPCSFNRHSRDPGLAEHWYRYRKCVSGLGHGCTEPFQLHAGPRWRWLLTACGSRRSH